MHEPIGKSAPLLAVAVLSAAIMACSSIMGAEVVTDGSGGGSESSEEGRNAQATATRTPEDPSPTATPQSTDVPPTTTPTAVQSATPAECEGLTPEECANQGTHEYLRQHEIHPYCEGEASFTEVTGTFTITFEEGGAIFEAGSSEFEATRVEPNVYSVPTSGTNPECREGVSTITFGSEGFTEDHACRVQSEDLRPCISFEMTRLGE